MKKLKKIAIMVLASVLGIFQGKGLVAEGRNFDGYYIYECCDGEAVYVEPLNRTYYIFEDRHYDDLANKREVTTEDMEYLIDRYVAMHPGSALEGCAQAFITASNHTGLDPIFFLALCGIESGWGCNETHVKLNNPYSFGMYGDGTHGGYSLGETFAEGIINGADYIYENYYKAGQKTLYSMNHTEGHSFCAGDSNWEYMVGSQMNYLNGLLEDRNGGC